MNCARFSRGTERSARKTAVVAPGSGSIGDSSTQCSDVDDDADEEEETDVEEGGWITNLPVSSTIVQRQPAFATTNGDIVLPNADQPAFGDVRVQYSKNVRLINQTCYNGPITLNQQFVYTNPTPNQDANRASNNTSDLSTSKDNGAPNGCVFPQNTKLNKATQWLWTWKRAVLSCVITLIFLAIVVPITVYFTHQSDASVFPEIPTSSIEGNCLSGKYSFLTQMLWTWKWYTDLSCVLALILLGIIVFITVHFTHQSDISPAPPEPTTPFKPTTPTTPSTPTTPEIPNSSTEDNCPSRKYFVMQARHEANGNNGTEFRIVERDEWGAQPSRPLRKMMLPVPYVIIFHTATAFCTTQSKCANQLRIIQNNQMEGIFDDIAYNFMVGGNGLAYVGRNWNYVGGHSRHYNGISIGIAFIGDFTSVVPPKTQLNAAKELIKFGVRAEKIAPDYKLLGARQVVTTKSPGDALYNEIIKWPHWSSEPYWLDRLVKSVYVS